MGQIKVTIQDHTGAKKTPVELPDDVSLKQLLPSLISKLSMPAIYERGFDDHYWEFHNSSPPTSLAYALDHKRTGRRLGSDDTLASAEVVDGDVLLLLPEIALGTPNIEDWMTFSSGKKFSELAVVVACRIGNHLTAFVLPKKLHLSGLRIFLSYQLLHRREQGLLNEVVSNLVKIVNEGVIYDITTHTRISFYRPEGLYRTEDVLQATVGDIIRTGDLITIELPSEKTTTEGGEQDMPSSIKIYPEDLR